MIHTVKGFGIANRAETDVFLELSCFLDDPADVSNLISGSSAFSKSNLNTWNSSVHIPRLSSVQTLSCADSLQPRGLQDTGLPCPSPTPGSYSTAIWGPSCFLFTLLFAFPQLLSNHHWSGSIYWIAVCGALIHIWRSEITGSCDISC